MAKQDSQEGLAARRAAFAVLNDVFFRRQSMDEAMARHLATAGDMESRDRAFVRVLVATILKRAREIDTVLASLLSEPLSTLRPANLINVFRIGVAQLAFLDTPAHAAVSTAVDLAAAEGITHHKPLVNAVLRRLSREGYPHLAPRDAGRAALPEWLWREWGNDYGVEGALDIAAACLDEAPVDFTLRGEMADWPAKLEATVLPSRSLRRASSGFVPALPGYDEGAWWVQSAAAALPAKMLGDVRGKNVVDLCAAPGGKTAQLAAMGARRVIALDRSAPRLLRLKENMTRLAMNDVLAVAADGSVWQPEEKADAVLLDAPCSATGTIRHQPDVLHLKNADDQKKLAVLQMKLVANAAHMLKPGGVLVYCTCSLQKAEGEQITDAVLASDLPLKLSPISADECDGIAEMLTPRGELRVLPTHWKEQGGMDGFYISRFTKP